MDWHPSGFVHRNQDWLHLDGPPSLSAKLTYSSEHYFNQIFLTLLKFF